MKREEAIKILQNPPRVYDEKMWEALDMAIKALSDQDKTFHDTYEQGRFDAMVEQEEKWKLVREEPPKSAASYLVTCKGMHGFIYTDYDFWTVFDEFKYHKDNVIAWMPFPKPYKESE